MMTPEQAIHDILGAVRDLRPGVERVALDKALGRILAHDFFAPRNLPGFDNSAMDGYALRSEDTATATEDSIVDLDIVGEQPAGVSRRLRVDKGQCARIFTGAPMPEGADAVVMQEDVKTLAGAIFLHEPVAKGEFIRKAGQDVCEGQKILALGTRLDDRHLGLLSALGVADIDVFKPLRVAIVVTGSELRKPGESLESGEIYESNGLMLAAQIAKAGAMPVRLPLLRDDPAQIATALEAALRCDAVVISGGMSVGAHDYVQTALNRCGVTPRFWRVAMKPGKPFLFSMKGRVPIFGLPGNPVSTFATFLIFVRPALRSMTGCTDTQDLTVRLPLGEKLVNDEKRWNYLRGVIRGGEGLFLRRTRLSYFSFAHPGKLPH
ncbi:molybdopterin molybdotransferase MoeA [Kamptonema cortianum]|nr:molybdopterin molybdotransferase MoeA [Kamptonema cortianum]MDL5046194.1 molybdopterin molybdotransferase MoeA [Oscillatoria amoena NRMC-F 0135]